MSIVPLLQPGFGGGAKPTDACTICEVSQVTVLNIAKLAVSQQFELHSWRLLQASVSAAAAECTLLPAGWQVCSWQFHQRLPPMVSGLNHQCSCYFLSMTATCTAFDFKLSDFHNHLHLCAFILCLQSLWLHLPCWLQVHC